MNLTSNLSLANHAVPILNISINNSYYINLARTSRPARSDAFSWSAVILALCAIGCAANSLVLYATWPKKTDKSGVNLLILHFIVANFLFCLIHNPLRCVTVVLTQFDFTIPIQVCYVFQNFDTMNWYVLFWADASLALNRCVALFLPHSYQSFSRTRNNVIQIVFMWLSALAMSVPGEDIMIPVGHCAWRTVRDGPPAFAIISLLYRNVPVVFNGAAAVLILGKCYWLSRTGFALGRGGERTGADGAAGPNHVKQRVRLAVTLVGMYLFAVLTNQSIQLITNIWPTVFLAHPAGILWMQIPLMLQYTFSACFFLVGNRKHWDRARGLICGSQRVEDANNAKLLTVPTKSDVVDSAPAVSQPPTNNAA